MDPLDLLGIIKRSSILNKTYNKHGISMLDLTKSFELIYHCYFEK